MATEPVALVGAYERDNFGDLLLGLVTQRLLDRPVSWTAPTAGTTDDLLGERVRPYPAVFGHGTVGGVWVVGGEVGGVSLRGMLRYNQLSADELDGTLEHPYLPRPSTYPGSADAPYVVNSAGISGLLRLKPAQALLGRAALREADAVSVRDPRSSALLDEWGIPHRLAPDVVHALPAVHPVAARSEETVIVQVRAKDTERLSPEGLAEVLGSVPQLAGLRLRMFVAGTAPGHDSTTHYRELVEAFRRRYPDRAIDIVDTRDPWELASVIGRSQLWIGTSLHGRIISAGYGVPRVSLDVAKVNRYAAQWDPELPHGVEVTQLAEAVDRAFAVDAASAGPRLTALAVDNARVLAEALDAPASDERRERRRASRERHLVELRATRPAKPPAPPPTPVARLKGALKRLLRR